MPSCYFCHAPFARRRCKCCKAAICGDECLAASWRTHVDFCAELGELFAGTVAVGVKHPREGLPPSEGEPAPKVVVRELESPPSGAIVLTKEEIYRMADVASAAYRAGAFDLESLAKTIEVLMPNLAYFVVKAKGADDLASAKAMHARTAEMLKGVTKILIGRDPSFFANVCSWGCVWIARWMYAQYELGEEHLAHLHYRALRLAAMNGHVEMLKLLCELFPGIARDKKTILNEGNHDENYLESAFELAAVNGHADVLRFFAGPPHNVRPDDLVASGRGPGYLTDLRVVAHAAVRRGRAAVLEVLAEKFGLTAAYAVDGGWASVAAISVAPGGDSAAAAVLHFLHARLGMTKNDVSDNAFENVLTFGRAEVARVLAEDYGFSYDDVATVGIANVVTRAASEGYADLLMVLFDEYQAREGVRAHCGHALRLAIEMGRVNVVRLLIDPKTYGMGFDDIRSDERLLQSAVSTSAAMVEILGDLSGGKDAPPSWRAAAYASLRYLHSATILLQVIASFGLRVDEIQDAARTEILENAAEDGDADVLTALADFGFGKADAPPLIVWEAARGSNPSLAVFRLLRDRFGAKTSDDFVELKILATAGNDEAVRWLRRVFEMDPKSEGVHEAAMISFDAASQMGNVAVMRALITADDVRSRDECSALRLAAEAGRPNALIFLHRELGLGAKDARARDNFALRVAASGSSPLVMMRTLHQEFGLAGDDARIHDNEIFKNAIKYWKLSVLEALAVEYGFDRADLGGFCPGAMRQIAERNDFRAIPLFKHRYGVDAACVRADNNKAMRIAAEATNEPTMRALKEAFDLTEADLRDAHAMCNRDGKRLFEEVFKDIKF